MNDLLSLLHGVAKGAPLYVLADFLEEAGDARADRVRRAADTPAKPLPPSEDKGNMPEWWEHAFHESVLENRFRTRGSEMRPTMVRHAEPICFVNPEMMQGGRPFIAHNCTSKMSGIARDYRILPEKMSVIPPELSREDSIMEPISLLQGVPEGFQGPERRETFWFGQCRFCQTIYWSWNLWPRLEDVAAGEAVRLKEVLRWFPEYQQYGTVQDIERWIDESGRERRIPQELIDNQPPGR